ncbi:MAG: glutamine-hydrolyzing GMP synthase [Patescibacteria group bacterium]
MEQPKILIVDLGSQYTQVIRRTMGELGYRSAVLSPLGAEKWLKNSKPEAIILSGGFNSVYDEGAPCPPESIFNLGVPILGICYGAQLLVYKHGGKITPSLDKLESKEYGKVMITTLPGNKLFQNLNGDHEVWTSHGDIIDEIPPGCKVIARSTNTQSIAAVAFKEKKMWGIMFHPEVTHTKIGKKILRQFVFGIAKLERDWNMKDAVGEIQEEAREIIGDKIALLAFSGGVDSSSTGKLLAPILGSRLYACFIDTGGLRVEDLEDARANAAAADVELIVIEASDLFFSKMANVVDAEIKRTKCFQPLYANILDMVAQSVGAGIIIQGGIATDHIESGKMGESALIKSHHNMVDFKIPKYDPLRILFKYEVRDISEGIGMPESVFKRLPFPGPGIFLRVNGMPATRERVKVVKCSDCEVRKILEKHDVYREISQLIVGLNCVDTVGIKGDGRVYKGSIVVRAVDTLDFMTAEGYQIPAEVRRIISREIPKNPEVNRVYFDETNKPPATTEFE